jgi:soluble lytic murein transglycosylase
MEKILNRKAVFLCLLLALIILFNSSFFWKAMYPVQYMEEVTEAAERFNVDPFLIYAIIQIESDFKESRVSSKGATGLMQIMPNTAEWIVQQGNFPPDVLDAVNDPKVNIFLGAWYIAFLEKMFQHNHYAVIAAYNAGPGNVEKWMKEDIWDGTSHDVANIPFGETRHYIHRVLYFYGKFKEIYR